MVREGILQSGEQKRENRWKKILKRGKKVIRKKSQHLPICLVNIEAKKIFEKK